MQKLDEGTRTYKRDYANAQLNDILSELKSIIITRAGGNVGGLYRNFVLSDLDKSGFLDKAEFTHAMARTGMNLSPPQVDLMYSAFDPNGDGEIEYEEFISKLGFTDLSLQKEEMHKLAGGLVVDHRGVQVSSVHQGEFDERVKQYADHGAGAAYSAKATGPHEYATKLDTVVRPEY